MKWKLQEYFNSRIPLILRRRNNIIYLQSQFEVARDDGLCAGIYSTYANIRDDSIALIGTKVLELLAEFEEETDLTLEEFSEITQLTMEEYELNKFNMSLKAVRAKDKKDLDLNYAQCFIEYDINLKKYSFNLDWIERNKRGYYYDCSESTGDPKILTFDKPLEFYSDISPEELGSMVLEAFDRIKKIEEKVNGKKSRGEARKQIDVFDEINLSVVVPSDRYFEDLEDGGVGELYQLYSYIPKGNSDPVANFYLGMAAELACNTSSEHVQKTWEEFYGVLEFFEMKEVGYGIFNLRVEMKNKKCHRISYLVQMDEDSLLECTMDLSQPGKRKKLDEKLSALFEEFALSCKWQGKKI